MTRIAHLTSVHPRYDTRIFHKMCRSLSAAGYCVNLIVADGKGNEFCHGIGLIDTGPSKGRIDRIFNASHRVFVKAVTLDADIYHLHDPELIPIGLKLKKLGKRVIFDSHEDVPIQMLNKPYLNQATRWLVSKIISCYEVWACKQFDGIIASTPFIRDKFLAINSNSVDINNFPLLGELEEQISWSEKAKEVCYIGSIDRIRGIEQMVHALSLVKGEVRLNLCGLFSESQLEIDCQKLPSWRAVNVHGFVDRDGVRQVLSKSVAGLVTLHPVTNYLTALPVKMFEYMAASIPVIASDFPLWNEIVVGNKCGICVDPMDSAAIAKAIDHLSQQPEVARKMGENGRRAVLERYNWSIEQDKLLNFYKKILLS